MIVAGFVMARTHWLGRSFWDGCERLIYFVLFPALLFAALTRTNFAAGQTALMVQISVLATLGATGLAALTLWIPGMNRTDWASGIQCAFRFNSYVAFALATRAAGNEGLALMALIVGVVVPMVNILAVSFLANTFHPAKLFRELSRNPLLLATLTGIAANLLGFKPPDLIYGVLDRASSASIALGLMCVGAGLSFKGFLSATLRWYATAITAIKLIALPAITWGLCVWLELMGVQRDMAILFATMPCASSAYILATRMGGNGPLTAGLISLSTITSMATITVWFAVLQSLG